MEIDRLGKDEAPLSRAAVASMFEVHLADGTNPGRAPFDAIKIWVHPAGGVHATFELTPEVCWSERQVRERYGFLGADVGHHRPWSGHDWVAQPKGYRLALHVDPSDDCVRSIDLSDQASVSRHPGR